MENTKIWVVSVSFGYSFGASGLSGAFLSKEEADFYAWDKNRNTDRNQFLSAFYSVREAPLLTREKTGKTWDSFVKERLAELEESIAKNTSHSVDDLARVEALKKERDALVSNK